MPTTIAETPRPAPPRAAGRVALALALALGLALPPAARAADLPKLATEVAFPNLQFDRPVALAYPDDGSNLLFVVEQHQAKI